MGSEVAPRPWTRKRIIAGAVGASLLVVLLVAGLTFSNSIGASRVASNAASLHWANATLGTSSLTRAALVQATTFVELEEDGRATPADVEFAMEQARSSLEELTHLEDGAAAIPAADRLSTFLDAVTEAVGALEDDDHVTAQGLILGEMEAAYTILVDSLQTHQQEIQAEIEDNTEAAARANGYIIFILTLAVPGAAVVSYWWIARRQVREYRIKAQADVEAERAVSRAKDSFIAGLSHELRTPLTSIYGFAEILSETSPDDMHEHQDVAQIIANEAAEMSRMVDDLLAASRLESTGVEIEIIPTRVHDVIESAIEPFERAGAEIHVDSSPDMVSADPGRLRHVLTNLVSNAVRHGGPNVGVEVTSAEGTVEIEVWDNGRGVPEDQVERLFQRFVHDGHQPLLTGSVGLGLAVASRLAGMMGGKLTYQRFAGKTYFTLRLPAYETEQAEAGDDGTVADVIRAMSA